METDKKIFHKKGRIALILLLALAALMLIGSINGLFTSSQKALPHAVFAYSANDTVLDDPEPPEENISYNASPGEYLPDLQAVENVNESLPANNSLVIDAGMIVSCRCGNCHDEDDGKKKKYWENSTTTTTLNDPSTTTTTSLQDSTTTTSSSSTTTTSQVRGTTTTTTTTAASSTTRTEGTTTTTSSTTTTTIPEAAEFSSAWFALAILLLAPAITFVLAKRI